MMIMDGNGESGLDLIACIYQNIIRGNLSEVCPEKLKFMSAQGS